MGAEEWTKSLRCLCKWS